MIDEKFKGIKNVQTICPRVLNTVTGFSECNNATDIIVKFLCVKPIKFVLIPCKNVNFDILIGMDVLKALDVTIKPNSGIVVNNKLIPFTFSEVIYNPEYVNFIQTIESDAVRDNLYKNLNCEEANCMEKLLKEFEDVCYKEGDKLTATTQVKHKINLTTETPIHTKVYKIASVFEKEVAKQIKEMLEQDIIVRSNSPYNAPLWIVPKKPSPDNETKCRLVVDFRKLNLVTIPDRHPIPNQEMNLAKLGNCTYFSTIDLAKGFHQIEIDEQDQFKTGFSTQFGHYHFKRMPFGLNNAPATFQRMMNDVLHDLIGEICVVYLDDVLIFGSSLQEIENTRKVLLRLRKHNLKVQIEKCKFFSHETTYLGHIVTENGIKPDPKYLEKIKNLSIPKSVEEIRSFLGFTGYYRKFIRNYAMIALPLTQSLKKGAILNYIDIDYIQAFHKL